MSNNEQWIIPAKFKELNKIQTQKKNELRDTLLKDCLHLLPEELWDIILNLLFNAESIVAYFEFKRKDKLYMDDHYLFRGTEKEWPIALNRIRSNVNPFDLQDDIPTDTYCSGFCELSLHMNEEYIECPDAKGHKCDCHWSHRAFNSEADFNAYYYAKKRHVLWTCYNGSGWQLWSINGDTSPLCKPSTPLHPCVDTRPLRKPSTPLHPCGDTPSTPLHPYGDTPSTPLHPCGDTPSTPLHPCGDTRPLRKSSTPTHPHCPGIVKMPKK